MANNYFDFVGGISDYIEKEYNHNEFTKLTNDEKYTIRSIIDQNYYNNGCISNTANKIIDYLRISRGGSKIFG